MQWSHYLKYIEQGHVESVQKTTTQREPDSPFEESIAQYIQSLGFVTHLQVGVAGFFIDIGVMVEGSHNYIIGIECDGAGYRSSKSARDRDRICQEILESMGWNIYRIWSTDWFKHRKEEELRLQNALSEAKNRAVFFEEEAKEVEIEAIALEDRGIEGEHDTEKGQSANEVTNKTDEHTDTLIAKLIEFRENVIAKKYSIDSMSILSDRMIELFSKNLPTTMEEFRMQIPLYLREKIDKNQMEYIDKIFKILDNG